MDIDIRENVLRHNDDLHSILLVDRTTKRNIIWATDSYENNGDEFTSDKQIVSSLVTGNYGSVIQPRASKSKEEQIQRTKYKAEVFTPLNIVSQINKKVDEAVRKNQLGENDWQKFVRELKIEIACGEGPFIVSRYNPTSHSRKIIKLSNRVGFLDEKLKKVSMQCSKQSDWFFWAKEAFKSSYGYEWQGDNILIARENLLYTFIDYYEDKFHKKPAIKLQEEIANIISWNIFQMDGLRYVIPMSCHNEKKIVLGNWTLFGTEPDKVEINECEGCIFNRHKKHNGKYVKIMDWEKNKTIRFVDLVNKSD